MGSLDPAGASAEAVAPLMNGTETAAKKVNIVNVNLCMIDLDSSVCPTQYSASQKQGELHQIWTPQGTAHVLPDPRIASVLHG
jgi:hypothetical protein